MNTQTFRRCRYVLLWRLNLTLFLPNGNSWMKMKSKLTFFPYRLVSPLCQGINCAQLAACIPRKKKQNLYLWHLKWHKSNRFRLPLLDLSSFTIPPRLASGENKLRQKTYECLHLVMLWYFVQFGRRTVWKFTSADFVFARVSFHFQQQVFKDLAVQSWTTSWVACGKHLPVVTFSTLRQNLWCLILISIIRTEFSDPHDGFFSVSQDTSHSLPRRPPSWIAVCGKNCGSVSRAVVVRAVREKASSTRECPGLHLQFIHAGVGCLCSADMKIAAAQALHFTPKTTLEFNEGGNILTKWPASNPIKGYHLHGTEPLICVNIVQICSALRPLPQPNAARFLHKGQLSEMQRHFHLLDHKNDHLNQKVAEKKTISLLNVKMILRERITCGGEYPRWRGWHLPVSLHDAFDPVSAVHPSHQSMWNGEMYLHSKMFWRGRKHKWTELWNFVIFSRKLLIVGVGALSEVLMRWTVRNPCSWGTERLLHCWSRSVQCFWSVIRDIFATCACWTESKNSFWSRWAVSVFGFGHCSQQILVYDHTENPGWSIRHFHTSFKAQVGNEVSPAFVFT